MDEQDFLRAIQANPDNETLRLVYADWLEEQGNTTKGEFLRLEHQLSRLYPGDNASHADPKLRFSWWANPNDPTVHPMPDRVYREMFGHLSQLARTLDVDWLVAASSLARGFRWRYEALTPTLGTNLIVSEIEWDDFEAGLREIFSLHFRTDRVEESFVIPVDYRLSLRICDATWRIPNWPVPGTTPTVLSSEDSLQRLREVKFQGFHRDLAPGFWVIAETRLETGFHCVCCDRSHDLYGAVALFPNDTPFGDPKKVLAPNWSAYLRHLFVW